MKSLQFYFLNSTFHIQTSFILLPGEISRLGFILHHWLEFLRRPMGAFGEQCRLRRGRHCQGRDLREWRTRAAAQSNRGIDKGPSNHHVKTLSKCILSFEPHHTKADAGGAKIRNFSQNLFPNQSLPDLVFVSM